MIISRLNLQNFRHFTKKELTFSPQTTIIIGPNAIGKTNILESIFLLSIGRSFRVENDREMIEFGKETGRVRGEIIQLSNQPIIQSTDEKTELEVLLTPGLVMGIKTQIKKYTVNGVPKRVLDFAGIIRIVLFWPQDLELVTGSPSIRRHYLDYVLMQTDREYRRNLHSYEKGLRQRNKVLEAIRDTGAHHHQLLFWDQLLIKCGDYITKKRKEYINFVNKFSRSSGIHDAAVTHSSQAASGQIPNSKFQMIDYQLVYDSSIISRDRLDQYSEEEVAAANTLVGPHRDEMRFKIRNPKSEIRNEEARDLSHFGSRGEQRLAVLWLKLAELAYIESISGDKPVLLLDDIFSELDHEHRKIIFDVIGNQQTIMTTTDIHMLEKTKLKDAKMIEL